MGLLHGFEQSIEDAEESIITSWKGDSADKPPTRMNEDLAHVRALLSRHGYREVSVVMGIDTELAAKGQLGSFYAPVSYTHLDVYKRQAISRRRHEQPLGNF